MYIKTFRSFITQKLLGLDNSPQKIAQFKSDFENLIIDKSNL